MTSAAVHQDVAPLDFLIGRWEGVGVGGYPTIESFRFGQELTFGHDGRPFLTYTSRTWLLDDEGGLVHPLASETGYWRVRRPTESAEGAAPTVEVLLAHPTGITEIYLGDLVFHRLELRTDMVARTETAKQVTAGHRLYGLVDGDLAYAYDMAAMGQSMQSHTSAQLKRVE